MDGTTTAPAPEHAAAENRSKRQGRVEVSVAQIIDRAENTPAPFRAGLFASVLSGLCLWACFPPLDLGFLAWLAPLWLAWCLQLTTASSWSTEAANGGTCGPSTASQPAFTPFVPVATSKVAIRFFFDMCST